MNNNYDEIDKLLFEYFEKKEEVPEIIVEGIKNAFNDRRKYNKLKLIIRKIIISIIGLITIAGGVVFADEIELFLNNLKANIFGTYNDGITTALENDYIAEIDMDYVESNGVKIKLDSVLLDDYNLGIIYNVLVNDDEYLKKLDVASIELKNLSILDENNNVIHADFENYSKRVEFFEKNNLDRGKFGYGFSNGETNKKIIRKTNNSNFLVSDMITSEKFPNSKKLYISFDTVYFLNSKVFYFVDDVYRLGSIGSKKGRKNDYVVVNGNWKFEVDLDELSQKRKIVEYYATDINDDDTIISNATLSMTNMKLELITSSKKIDYEKLKGQNRENLNVIDMIPFNEIYIETANGDKFYEIGENGYDNLEDGKIRYYTTFNYTYFDKEDNIKLVLPTNKREEIIVELKINKKGDQ